ncbi:helix-turn-helix domain-containing protein [Consotaella salsifontis]|uniref:DNA binding domain-containing protein, excisionase family n=1 Tax=Consotaella salsifontis TaxID=1365950 RepID=A0A1T4SE18_9HYPH|nr:helix-turn-helix domain-containing protein [Consotaella salsifontis]SKA26473.1 DNA binding domain-containing protein, excisionase family [Consotaella salsifontis]
MTNETDEPLDLVWGIKAIAKLIGRTERATYAMCADGKLPARRVGERWVAKREALERFFAEVDAA